MAGFTIKTRDLGELYFHCRDAGGYVWVRGTHADGQDRQICDRGYLRGETLTASAETLAAVAREWNRQRRHNLLKHA